MNISFDLDSTLIPNGNEFETEKENWKTKLFKVEKLRKGTKQLISILQEENHKVNIYTTSFRSKNKIRLTFWCYNIKVNRIVNQTENKKKLESLKIYSSKYPKAFNFDLHIDDSKGVEIESEKYNFNVLIVAPNDLKWNEKIINKIKTNG
ncbi:HAD family hydrolase [Flavobacterium sp. I3-2]|uniref:HAD family hydrolase n=1 Tax=Flavobacterium sp. I3-2 TaxID=2748319 RepID=UPI0015ACA509|nr:HAD family hydrolase [Flavobacterium sp. I3-2]